MGDVVSRVVGAIAKAATGNVEGAWNDLKAVPDDLGKRWNAFGDNVVAQSTRNAKAMALAWGWTISTRAPHLIQQRPARSGIRSRSQRRRGAYWTRSGIPSSKKRANTRNSSTSSTR